jgi:hypothetical protein
MPFRVYKVQDDGKLHFIEATQSFEDAKARADDLSKSWPGEYVIHNEGTGERLRFRLPQKTQ